VRPQGLKELVQELLKRGGLSVGAYRHSYRARRQRIIATEGVELAVDVGANDGRWVVDLRRGGYNGRVISFEPDSRAYRDLCVAAARDAEWDHRQVAVGDGPSTLILNLSESALWNSFLPIAASTVEAEAKAQYIGIERVPVERLDDLLSSKESLLVKVDVQGFERQVFEGAPETLAKALLVEVELTPVALYEGQDLMLQVMETLERNGLTLALVENVAGRPDGRAMAFNGLFVRK
jgi:FkbM family methyltransferase